MNKNKKIRLSKSVLGKEEAKAASRVILEDGYLGMGKTVQAFEEKLKQFLGGGREVVCVNSGTAALHLAVMAALRPGEEVLVQSLTFLASFQAISAAGAVPVACEVDPRTVTIDLKDAKRRLSDKTRAIMPVHYASRTGELDEIYKFAKAHNLRVIEDAAHAFGGTYKGKKIGTFGDIACFSFDGIKNITAGEGGAVISDDADVIQFVKDSRLLGIERDTEKRYQSKRSWEFDVTHQGYRYHMSNIFAAIGLAQLEKFEKEFKPRRQMLAKRYHKELSGLEGVMLFPDDYDDIVPHIFPIRVLNNKRDGLRQHLLDAEIECGIHYYPNHLLSYYGGRKGEFPLTEKIYSELLTLPLHPDLSENDQDRVIEELKSYFKKVV